MTLAACGVERRTGSGAYTVSDSAGIEIVESTAAAWPGGERLVEPEPLLRIGREEEGPYQFTYVPFGMLRDDGGIVVGDIGAQEVRAFDAAGRHVGTFGGAGEGPGEFRGLAGLFAYRGDSLAAFDGRLQRITVFDATLSGGRTFAYRIEGNYGVFGVARDSLFLLYSPGGSYRPDLEPGLQWVMTDIIAMSPDGAHRTVARHPDRLRRVAEDGNAPMPQPLHYAVQAVARDGYYWATPDHYRIALHGTDGELRRILRRPIEPRAVEPDMVQMHIDRSVERVLRMQGEEAAAGNRRRLEEETYGETLPLFASALLDSDGRLWIAGSSWPAEGPPERWSVFAPEGNLLGDIVLPDRLMPLDSRGDTLLAVWRDEFDVPHVQLHRIGGR
jgi:hypothetical protein